MVLGCRSSYPSSNFKNDGFPLLPAADMSLSCLLSCLGNQISDSQVSTNYALSTKATLPQGLVVARYEFDRVSSSCYLHIPVACRSVRQRSTLNAVSYSSTTVCWRSVPGTSRSSPVSLLIISIAQSLVTNGDENTGQKCFAVSSKFRFRRLSPYLVCLRKEATPRSPGLQTCRCGRNLQSREGSI